MSTPKPIPASPTPTLPNLPCPYCGSNLLEEGFYNSCTERKRLQEETYAYLWNRALSLEHDEHHFATINHQCDVNAFCCNCDQLLPWPLFRMRQLDGISLALAEQAVSQLLAELDNAGKSEDA